MRIPKAMEKVARVITVCKEQWEVVCRRRTRFECGGNSSGENVEREFERITEVPARDRKAHEGIGCSNVANRVGGKCVARGPGARRDRTDNIRTGNIIEKNEESQKRQNIRADASGMLKAEVGDVKNGNGLQKFLKCMN